MKIPTTVQGKPLTPLLLRAALALVFGYASIASFVHPTDWVGYLPAFLRDSAQATQLLHVFSVFELALAVWLVSGLYVRWAALAAAGMLAGIVTSNLSLFAITFRDAALVLTALALFFSEDKQVN
jgi:uncharacterized membrane protein YphA (DoxX/SURF4 family)